MSDTRYDLHLLNRLLYDAIMKFLLSDPEWQSQPTVAETDILFFCSRSAALIHLPKNGVDIPNNLKSKLIIFAIKAILSTHLYDEKHSDNFIEFLATVETIWDERWKTKLQKVLGFGETEVKKLELL